jgi:hypothetical protein
VVKAFLQRKIPNQVKHQNREMAWLTLVGRDWTAEIYPSLLLQSHVSVQLS